MVFKSQPAETGGHHPHPAISWREAGFFAMCSATDSTTSPWRRRVDIAEHVRRWWHGPAGSRNWISARPSPLRISPSCGIPMNTPSATSTWARPEMCPRAGFFSPCSSSRPSGIPVPTMLTQCHYETIRGSTDRPRPTGRTWWNRMCWSWARTNLPMRPGISTANTGMVPGPSMADMTRKTINTTWAIRLPSWRCTRTHRVPAYSE